MKMNKRACSKSVVGGSPPHKFILRYDDYKICIFNLIHKLHL